MKFISTKYPELVVHDVGVTFVDGEANVTVKSAIDALKALPPEMGVRAAGGRPATERATSD